MRAAGPACWQWGDGTRKAGGRDKAGLRGHERDKLLLGTVARVCAYDVWRAGISQVRVWWRRHARGVCRAAIVAGSLDDQ